VLTDIRSHFRAESWISTRISSVSRSFRKKIGIPQSRAINGTLYFLLSGFLGFTAFQWAQDDILSQWRKSHFPSLALLKGSLAGLGWSEMRDPAKVQRTMRSLPVSTDQSVRLWYTSDLEWVAIFTKAGQEEDSSLRVFCRSCSSAAQGWGPASLGWEGFEEVLKAIEKKKANDQLVPQAAEHKRLEARDSREIIY